MNPIRIGSFNLLNLRSPGRTVYACPALGHAEYREKTRWLAQTFDRMDCALIGVQEVFDEEALQDCAARSRIFRDGSQVVAPGASGGADVPRVGLVSRLPVLALESIAELPPQAVITLPGAPELGLPAPEHRRFSRPVLVATVDFGTAGVSLPVRVYVLHLKSRRPKRLEGMVEAGPVAESIDDPAIEARAHMRSLMIRAAEATGVRLLLLRDLVQSRLPVIVMGDFNDHAKALTTEIVTGRMANRQLERRDHMLWHAAALQRPHALKRDLGYTKIHLGEPDSIDHVLLSEEFLPGGRHAIGEVIKVDYFNDHLNDRNPLQSDHGAIRVSLRLHT